MATEQATFAAGCFWCIEAAFLELRGVSKIVSGYTGGTVENPTYEQVCKGTTGHAEVIQIDYDPEIIGYERLLEVFWAVHDPTSLNRQGADVGTQYRSAIFYHNPQQRQQAEASKQKLEESGTYSQPIVTEIQPLDTFYPAEAYHQNYFAMHPNQPYCVAVAQPKIDKVRKLFGEALRDG